VAYGGYIYTSSDYGVTWATSTGAGSRYWFSVSISSDGKYQTAVAYNGYIYTSSDYGVTWATSTGAGSRTWRSVSISSDGKYQTAVVDGGYIYTFFADSYIFGGNVGIGTTAPQQKLTLSSGSNFAVEMAVPTGVTASTSTGGTLNGTYYYKVSASDGVGWTTLSSEVSATVDGGTTAGTINVSWSAVTGATKYRVWRGTSSGGENAYYETTATSISDNGSLTFTSGTTPPTVTTAYVNKITASGNSWFLGGNVGIGTMTFSAKLHVYGSASTDNGVLINIATTSSSYYALNVQSAGTSRLYVRADGNVGIGTTTPAYKLDVNGRLGATLTQSSTAGTAVHINLTTREIYAYTSSLRFKHDITDLEIDSSKIFDLRPVSFTPNDSDRRDFGLIAEEVASILPELVLYDSEGRPTAVRYEQLSVLLLNEMKKQKKEIEELKLAINEYGNLTQNSQELVNSQSANSLTETIKQLLEKLGLFIENGIAKLKEIIAEKLTANIVVTNQLCVGKVCVDETKFKELLEKNGIEPIILENSSSTTSTTESSALTTDTSTTTTPTVTFIGSPYFGTTSQPLTFSATTTEFTTTTLIFNWNFGDGNSKTTDTPSVTYTYNATGTFTLILSVQGGDKSASASTTVEIKE
jgi:hypothetical protein